ncbi:hypothetical protein MNBD_NITROSPINAE01-1632 [hydrothermal vent metagenome]|uniref:Ice-binding protein C-terminal domain-containing protein n=1 Tax=hydrothermal vent metagenome TaxID=652676 RepID=A0A3B1BWE2_9ZZZZ
MELNRLIFAPATGNGTKSMKYLGTAIVIVVLFAISTTANATSVTNVALNKQVTLDGIFFNPYTWGHGGSSYPTKPSTPSAMQALADTVTDGKFKHDGAQWNKKTVWWDTHHRPSAYVNIDLGGTFYLESFIVQADDNDAYLLEYWDLNVSNWATAWNVPNVDWRDGVNLWGMQTRPKDDDDDSDDDGDDDEKGDDDGDSRHVLGSPIKTTKLRLSGVGGDKYYSTSEIQAFGYKSHHDDDDNKSHDVPEPATLLLLGAGLVAGRAFRRK